MRHSGEGEREGEDVAVFTQLSPGLRSAERFKVRSADRREERGELGMNKMAGTFGELNYNGSVI